MVKRKPSTVKLQVFMGREARLNKAIFHTLAHKDPQTIYGLSKEIRSQKGLGHTKYTNINRRVRALEVLGYLEITGTRKTPAGFESKLYHLTERAYLSVLLNQISFDCFIQEADDSILIATLGAFIQTMI